MQSLKSKKGNKFIKLFFLFLVIVIIVGGFMGAAVFFEDEKPQIVLDKNLQYLGKKTDFSFSIKDQKTGIRSIAVLVKQGEKEILLFEKSYPRNGYYGQIGPILETKTVHFQLAKSGFKDGEAEIIITAKDYSLRGLFKGNLTEIRKTVTIDTVPPKVRLMHAERYIAPGGSGIVIYQLSGNVELHGAEFGGNFHKGHLVGDGRDDVYLAFIGLPYNATTIGSPKVYAKDPAGNEKIIPFSPILQKPRQRFDRINVSNGFLNAKMPEFEQYYPNMTGSMKDKYIYINNIVRLENNQKIFELCQQSISERMWTDRFLRMAGASRAGFADHRTYYYNDKEIDKQVHLGMDIASTRRAEVKAANKGKVIFGDYLGIYGNMVILDHGQGVFSLYSHLSQIQVAVDDIIDSGVVLGLTGTSGMAGGDHLHFSMLINGIFVTPKEWWDRQWIEVTIEEPLADSRF